MNVGADLLVVAIGRGLVALFDVRAPFLRIVLVFLPLLGWLFLLGLLYAWIVGMVVEDRAMTLSRAIAAGRGRAGRAIGLLVAGVVPLMILHYALGYAAIGRSTADAWALMSIDAALVGVMTLAIASSWFTIYRLAAARRSLPDSSLHDR